MYFASLVCTSVVLYNIKACADNRIFMFKDQNDLTVELQSFFNRSLSLGETSARVDLPSLSS